MEDVKTNQRDPKSTNEPIVLAMMPDPHPHYEVSFAPGEGAMLASDTDRPESIVALQLLKVK